MTVGRDPITGGPKKPAPSGLGQQPVVTERAGTSKLFQALNFELFAKPTGSMKVLAYAGTAVFIGVLGWLEYERYGRTGVLPSASGKKQ